MFTLSESRGGRDIIQSGLAACHKQQSLDTYFIKKERKYQNVRLLLL
jgi:hypothetical protein